MQLLRGLAVLATCSLFGCAYPRTIHVYDEECQITARRMVLEVNGYQGSVNCANSGCVAQLVTEAAVLAGTVVISGSIAVAGNVVYWLEKKRDCRPKQALKEPPSVGD